MLYNYKGYIRTSYAPFMVVTANLQKCNM